jgi:ComEC/Rec2-related protein
MKYTNGSENESESVNIEALVLKNTYYNTFSSGYDIVIKKINDEKVNYKAKLAINYPCDINYNEMFMMNVTLSEFEDSDNISGFPIKTYNISKGFVLQAESNESDTDISIYPNDKFSINKFLGDCNKFCSDILRTHLNNESYVFADAILLGNHENLPAPVKRDLNHLGLSHIISVSGMHFSILMGAAAAVLKILRFDKRFINAFVILFSVFLMGITGFSPSVTRSALMFIMYSLAFLIRSESDSIISLFSAVSLMCIISPNAILDIGLLMSFTATLGILTMGTSANRFIRKQIRSKYLVLRVLKNIISAFNITVSAVLFTLPIVWLNLGTLSIISPITNILSTIPVTLILSFSPLVIIFSKIPPLVFVVRVTVEFMYKIFTLITDYFTDFETLTVSLNYPFVKYVMIILIGGLIALTFVKYKNINKNPLIYFVPIIIAGLTFSAYLHYYNLAESEIVRITYLTYKKNDGFIVKHGDKAMICDISDGSYGITNAAENLLSNMYNVVYPDTYMFTHYHRRHISTLYKLSQNSYIKNIILPEPVTELDNSIFYGLMEIIENNGYNVTLFTKSRDTVLDLFDNVMIEIAQYTKLARSTHPVLALSISAGDQKATYFGSSAFEAVNAEYLTYQLNEAETLIFGQHGPIIKNPIEIANEINFFKQVIYANDEIKQYVTNFDTDAKQIIHNEENLYSEVVFYVH